MGKHKGKLVCLRTTPTHRAQREERGDARSSVYELKRESPVGRYRHVSTGVRCGSRYWWEPKALVVNAHSRACSSVFRCAHNARRTTVLRKSSAGAHAKLKTLVPSRRAPSRWLAQQSSASALLSVSAHRTPTRINCYSSRLSRLLAPPNRALSYCLVDKDCPFPLSSMTTVGRCSPQAHG